MVNELTWEFADGEVTLKGLECSDGEVDRVFVLASGAVVGNSDCDCFTVVRVGDLDLLTTEGGGARGAKTSLICGRE